MCFGNTVSICKSQITGTPSLFLSFSLLHMNEWRWLSMKCIWGWDIAQAAVAAAAPQLNTGPSSPVDPGSIPTSGHYSFSYSLLHLSRSHFLFQEKSNCLLFSLHKCKKCPVSTHPKTITVFLKIQHSPIPVIISLTLVSSYSVHLLYLHKGKQFSSPSPTPSNKFG